MGGNFTQKWTIISLLEDAYEGRVFSYLNWPSHITWAGVFAINSRSDQLTEELESALLFERSFDIEPENLAMFGPERNIEVMIIKKTVELMNLYNKIHKYLSSKDVVYNLPEFEGPGFIPHCTNQKTSKLNIGESALISSVSLVDMFPDGDGLKRRISKTFQLK